MKYRDALIRILRHVVALAFLSTLNVQLSTALAQGTAFTYQGRLVENGSPANGSYDLRCTLYDALSGGSAVAGPITNASAVSNGLFTVALDFGLGAFTGTNRWLEIGVRTNGGGLFIPLNPRQQVTPTPYAIMAGTASNLSGTLPTTQLIGTLPSAQLAGTYSGAVTFNNAGSTFNGAFSGNGAGLSNVNSSTLGGLSSSSFWKTGGNGGTTAGVNFLGTADDQALELKVNGTRALRLEPNTYGAPNVIGGSPNNMVSAGVIGATISGGGAVNWFGNFYSNKVSGMFGTVGGGGNNLCNQAYATVAGGLQNSSYFGGTVSGGAQNTSSGDYATVGGGYGNISSGIGAPVVGGGVENNSSGSTAAIGGGYRNTSSGDYATVGGGYLNNNSGFVGTVGGGYENTNSGDYATVGGGVKNTSSGFGATVGGGLENSGSGFAATVGGGANNTATGSGSFIGGGGYDDGSSFLGNTAAGSGSFIGGGVGNFATKREATVGGGYHNQATNSYATIPGGANNIAGGQSSFAAGNQAKALHNGSFVWADSQGTDFSSTGNDQFLIRAAGGVGIGTANPLAQLAVDGNTRIDGRGGAYSEGLVLNCPSDMSIPGGYGGIVFHNANRGVALSGGTVKWGVQYNYAPELSIAGGGIAFVQNNANTRLYLSNNGNVGIGTTSPQTALHVVGDILATGTVCANNGVNCASDRNVKAGFESLNAKAILEKVAALPITRWYYTNDTATSHVGPMAQDFYAAFNLGTDDKHIATVDADGVALAAIQGLNQKLDEKDAEIQELKTAMKALTESVEKLAPQASTMTLNPP